MENIDRESENETKSNRRVERRNIVSEVFTDYCASTSLHGMGYIGAKDKRISEKIWWLIVFVLSLSSCSYLIMKTWIKWKTDSIILSFEKEQIPIWEIPFPAVTICPVNKVLQLRYNYTEKFRNRDNMTEGHKKFWDISLICNLEQFIDTEFNCSFKTTDEEALNNIADNAPGRSATIMEPKWQSKAESFYEHELFNTKVTEEGLCFTFNALSPLDVFNKGAYIARDLSYLTGYQFRSNWTLEKGYPDKMKKTDYPRRTTKDGITSGLTLQLSSTRDNIDFVCGMPITGYKIILHNPADIPDSAQQYILIPSNMKANIVIKPELTKTSETLKSISAETRKCYFDEEKSLKFFKIYTQSNCRMECTANVTYQYCDCIPFYLPRFENTTICGFASMECVKEVEDNILELEMGDTSTATKEEKERIEFTREIYMHCNCLPSCNSLQYNYEISQSEYHFARTMKDSGLADEDIPIEFQEFLSSGYIIVSHVDIFFKESQFYALKRSEIYGRVDFLANVGGLLGLFMGFSLLSLLEIVYFLTIRIWVKYRDKNEVK